MNVPSIKSPGISQVSIAPHGKKRATEDIVTVEEPLEIRLGHGPYNNRKEFILSITMRTPGNDHELAAGFVLSEGIVSHPDQIASVTHCSNNLSAEGSQNVIRIELDEEVSVNTGKLQRHFYTSSSCGVCGKASLEALELQGHFKIKKNQFMISESVMMELPSSMRESQKIFNSTGGIHATACFDSDGKIHQIYEDVGRHNALDKLLGHFALQAKIPLQQRGILVSGRISFELVQKVMMAGCPMIAGIGAPSSLAIDAAKKFNISLIGFLNERGFNQYCNLD